MNTSMDKEWHSSAFLQETLEDFHRSNCELNPIYKLEKVAHHKRFMAYLREKLKTAVDFKATGSTAEGIKVPTSRMEFDVMVIFSADENFTLEEIPGNALYAKIRHFGTYQRYVSPYSVVSSLYSTLDILLQGSSCRSQGFYAKLRRHGPAVQMDVYEDQGRQNLFYHVDMVPSYRFKINNRCVYYVPKSDSSCESPDRFDSWRRSFSLEEVKRLRALDADGGCRKHCMRILKALMKDTEAGLHHINSYVIKTAMLSLLRDISLDWSQENLGQRFMDYLMYIALALGRGCLPHYFVGTFNILQPPHAMVYTNMHYRLKELIRSEDKFYKLMPRVCRLEMQANPPRVQYVRLGSNPGWCQASQTYQRSRRSESYPDYYPSTRMSGYGVSKLHLRPSHSPDESNSCSSSDSLCWKLISCCATVLFLIIKVCLFMVFLIFIGLLTYDSHKH